MPGDVAILEEDAVEQRLMQVEGVVYDDERRVVCIVDRLNVVVDVDNVHVDHAEYVAEWLKVVDDVGSSQVDEVDWVDIVVGKVEDVTVMYVVNDVVDESDAVPVEGRVVAQVDLDVGDVLVVQGLLEVVERCLEGTREGTNPNDVEYAVDDVHHSFDGVVDVHLVHDDLLNLDVGFLLDGYLDDLLVLDAVELQSPFLDDQLDLPGRHDVFYLLYDDTYVDDVHIVDVKLVLLILDGLVFLDDDSDMIAFLCQGVDVFDDDHSHSHYRHQSPDC